LYWSIQQADAYPHAGNPEMIGEGPGVGFTISTPLPPESGDDVYKTAFDTVFPVAAQFRPDVIAVSAGFDGYHSDPLLELHLTTNTYYYLGRQLAATKIPLFAVLEGGYDIVNLPRCVRSFIDGVNGEAQRDTEDPSESRVPELETVDQTLNELKGILAPYWNL
jgi:acetoin utilization deacetylase AcuC-like enzyme